MPTRSTANPIADQDSDNFIIEHLPLQLSGLEIARFATRRLSSVARAQKRSDREPQSSLVWYSYYGCTSQCQWLSRRSY